MGLIQPKGLNSMAKSTGSGPRNENPPPRTSPKVEGIAGKNLSTGNKTARTLAASVLRHIEPRKPSK